jgi:hypothetical protein
MIKVYAEDGGVGTKTALLTMDGVQALFRDNNIAVVSDGEGDGNWNPEGFVEAVFQSSTGQPQGEYFCFTAEEWAKEQESAELSPSED